MRRTAAEAAQTRAQVLDAALSEFAQRGWEKATFERIAGRAELTRGAVHHHFPQGKEQLLRELLVEQWGRFEQPVLKPLHQPNPGAGGLLRFLSGYLELLADDEAFRALVTVTTMVAPQATTRQHGMHDHRQALDTWRATLWEVFTASGLLRPGVTADTAVFVVINFLLGLTTTAAIEPDQLPATAAERQAAAEAMLAGLIDGTGR